MRLMTGIRSLQLRLLDRTGPRRTVKSVERPRGVDPLFDWQAALFDGVAGHRAAFDRDHVGSLDPAALVGGGTARMEGAACGWIDPARHLACPPHALPAGHVEVRDRVEQ